MRVFKGIGYILYLFGASVGGFPPPRRFAREEQPAEELVRVLEDEFVPERRDVLEEWGFRVVDPLSAPPRPVPSGRRAGSRQYAGEASNNGQVRRRPAGERQPHLRVPETPC